MENQWEPTIREFEAAEKESPSPVGAVVFTGSSTIAMWATLQQDFPFVQTVNRAFGGSVYAEVAMFAHRIVAPLAPSLVVAYAGDNDLASGLSPEQILVDVDNFVAVIRQAQPGVPMIFIGVKPSPSRANLMPAMRRTNELLRAYAAAHAPMLYVDMFDAMLDAQGRPRPELFLEDMLHMNAAGYALWRDILGPVLKGCVEQLA